MAFRAKGRFLTLLCACLFASPLNAKPLARLTWDAFGAQARPGCSIRMVLPDGVQIEGHLVSFRPEAMDLSVYKTSNKQAHPKGFITIPRKNVSVLEMRARRYKGRLIGTLVPIGLGGAMLAGGLTQSDEGILYSMLAAGGLTMGAGAPSGYFVGRAIDRRFESFLIVP
ncbi:MAG: hypothetical protein JNN08_15555 [Bryobacterales bacterium]|nr:hypothetical protein [Bryobacterales bacterium]